MMIEKLQEMPGEATVLAGRDHDSIVVNVIEVGGFVLILTDEDEEEEEDD
jgi:hypothetical protein